MPGKLKKLNSIHREGIRIYTGAFKTSPVEALHVEENERSIKSIGVYLRKSEQRYMEEQEVKEINQIQSPCPVNKISYCNKGETHTENDSKKKQNFHKAEMTAMRESTKKRKYEISEIYMYTDLRRSMRKTDNHLILNQI